MVESEAWPALSGFWGSSPKGCYNDYVRASMRTLEPRRIKSADVMVWLWESIGLLWRRPLLNLSIVTLFFLLEFFGLQAIAPIASLGSPVIVLAILFIYLSFALISIMMLLVLGAAAADHSRPLRFSQYIMELIRQQKNIFRVALLALFVGSFFWIFSCAISPDRDFYAVCDTLVNQIVSQIDFPIGMELLITSGLLYFLFLALFFLRTVFSLPLFLFHELDYDHAQRLSHKAIIINLAPMTVVLFSGILLLLIAMKLMSAMSIFLLPMMASFIYVSYRHIFLGVTDNLPAKVMAGSRVTNAV